jgi:ectoine hydroxylase-related dioxygenase (phytanoyl-CoA dioxygenase family)
VALSFRLGPKGTRYWGNTPWHTDSDLPIASLGVVAYFEPLRENSGALRVLPGSHRAEFADALRALGAAGKPAEKLPGYVLETEPGDLIVFDEHLFHASFGGEPRHSGGWIISATGVTGY